VDCGLTFSLSTPPYLARIRGSRTVARLVPVTVRRVPPLEEGMGSQQTKRWPSRYGRSDTAPSEQFMRQQGTKVQDRVSPALTTPAGEEATSKHPHLLMLHSGSILRMVGSSV
jgi:hypothetical protein